MLHKRRGQFEAIYWVEGWRFCWGWVEHCIGAICRLLWEWCESDVRVMWWWCEGDVEEIRRSNMWGWYENDVRVIWWWCEGDIGAICEADVRVMWWWCEGDVGAIRRSNIWGLCRSNMWEWCEGEGRGKYRECFSGMSLGDEAVLVGYSVLSTLLYCTVPYCTLL